jgi:FkbM family methyltransferase
MSAVDKVRRRLDRLRKLISSRKAAKEFEQRSLNDPNAPLFALDVNPANFRRAVLEVLDNRIFCPAVLVKREESGQFAQGRRLIRKSLSTTRPARFQGNGFVLEIPECFPRSEEVALNDFVEIFVENHYLSGFPYGCRLDDDAVVLDCGANIGAFTVFAAQLGKRIRVIAFEPEPQTFAALRRNVELNQLTERVECFPVGLSDKKETKTFLLNPDCFTTHRFADANEAAGSFVPGASQSIECVTVDEMVLQRNLARCDFIKMDVEGGERLVLKGATETIRRFRPCLSMAAYHYPDDAFVLPMIIREICPDYHIIVSREAHLYAFCQNRL